MKSLFCIFAFAGLLIFSSCRKHSAIEEQKYIQCYENIPDAFKYLGIPMNFVKAKPWPGASTMNALDVKNNIGVFNGDTLVGLYTWKMDVEVYGKTPGGKDTSAWITCNANVVCPSYQKTHLGMGFHDMMYQDEVIGFNYHVVLQDECGWGVAPQGAYGVWNYSCTSRDSTKVNGRAQVIPSMENTFEINDGSGLKKLSQSQYLLKYGSKKQKSMLSAGARVEQVSSYDVVEFWYNGKAVYLNLSYSDVADFLVTWYLGLNKTSVASNGEPWKIKKIRAYLL